VVSQEIPKNKDLNVFGSGYSITYELIAPKPCWQFSEVEVMCRLRAERGLVECGNAAANFTSGIFVVVVVELRIVRFGGRRFSLALGLSAACGLKGCGWDRRVNSIQGRSPLKSGLPRKCRHREISGT
jgi:hypothetical protein